MDGATPLIYITSLQASLSVSDYALVLSRRPKARLVKINNINIKHQHSLLNILMSGNELVYKDTCSIDSIPDISSTHPTMASIMSKKHNELYEEVILTENQLAFDSSGIMECIICVVLLIKMESMKTM